MIKLLRKITLMFLILTTMSVLVNEFLFWQSSADRYFEYDEANPVEYRHFEKGFMYFHSNAVVHRTTNLVWDDTPQCINQDGLNIKFNTQHWEERKAPSENLPNDVWGYKITNNYTLPMTCTMCGTVVGFTDGTVFKPEGYAKTYDYCISEFVVE